MFSFLKSPVSAPLITDKREVDALYRYWRRHILTTIWLGYALFYFTRKSFNAAVPDILTSGVLTRSDIGLLASVVGIFLCWRLRDRPQAIGLPPIGDWRHDELEIAQQQEGAGLSRKEILTRYVLLNPYIWLLSLCYVLVYVVRAAINDWGNLYMSETLGVDLVTANSAVTMFELGGFIGALVAGWGSDKLFNGNRGPMNLIFAAGILLSVGSLWLMPFASYVMQAACFFTTGFFVFGPQMLIGMAAAECSHKEAAGAATGFVGLFAYLGASLSGWPLAKVMEVWHWSGFFVVIAIAAGISALLLLPFLNAQAPRELNEA